LGVGWLDAGLFSRLGWLGVGLFWTLGWPDAGGFTTGGRFSSAPPPPLAMQAEHSQAISNVGKLTARRLTWRDITYGTAVPILNGATFEPAAIDQAGSSPLICSPAIVLNPSGADVDEDREQVERLAADVVSHLR
jgi:hypothetical protein